MDTPFLLTLICLRLNSRCSKKKKSDIEKERGLALVIDWPVKTYPNKRMNWTKIIWSVPNRTWIKIFNNQFFNTKYDTQFDDRSINSIMGRKYSLKEVSSDDHCPWENTLTPSNLLSQFHPSSSYLLISIINQILKLQVKLSMSWFLVFFSWLPKGAQSWFSQWVCKGFGNNPHFFSLEPPLSSGKASVCSIFSCSCFPVWVFRRWSSLYVMIEPLLWKHFRSVL